MKSILRKTFKIILYVLVGVFILGFLIPENYVIPVKNASENDWNKNSFWAYPWGKSITHKGIDIFAPEGRNVLSSVPGIVLFKGSFSRGGNVLLILGPKWRFHYYAHLKSFTCEKFEFLVPGALIGQVGKTGNAANTPAHLHYSIVTLIPYPWNIGGEKQRFLKAFYLNPDYFLSKS